MANDDKPRCKAHPLIVLEDSDCSGCDGDGMREDDDDDTYSFRPAIVTCRSCKGIGVFKSSNCYVCDWEFEEDRMKQLQNTGCDY